MTTATKKTKKKVADPNPKLKPRRKHRSKEKRPPRSIKTAAHAAADHSKDNNPTTGKFLPGNKASLGVKNHTFSWRTLIIHEAKRVTGKGASKKTVADCAVKQIYKEAFSGGRNAVAALKFIFEHVDGKSPQSLRVEHDQVDPEIARLTDAELEAIAAAGVGPGAEGEEKKEGEG